MSTKTETEEQKSNGQTDNTLSREKHYWLWTPGENASKRVIV